MSLHRHLGKVLQLGYLLNPKPGLLVLGLVHCNGAGVSGVGRQRLQLNFLSSLAGLRWLVGIAHHQDVVSYAERVLVHCPRLEQHLTVIACQERSLLSIQGKVK